MKGKHIELFLVDGVAGGLTTAEIAGWTGHILAGPRVELTRILNERDEVIERNGVYILLGNDFGVTEQTRAYIGRTENFVRDCLIKCVTSIPVTSSFSLLPATGQQT